MALAWHPPGVLQLCVLTGLCSCFVQGAVKLCNAGLQKYPDCHTFRALKAVALERSGKRDEALQVGERWLSSIR